MDTLLKVRDSGENLVLLASSRLLRGRSFVGIGPFEMSEHSRQLYWSQFIHFSWFYRPGIPSSHPNTRIQSCRRIWEISQKSRISHVHHPKLTYNGNEEIVQILLEVTNRSIAV